MGELTCRCGQHLERCCSRGCGRCTSGHRCPRHGKDWAVTTGGGLFSAGRSGSGDRCRKDQVPVVNCPHCRGRRGRTCGTCGGTGQTCPVHGRFWT
ncbi:hypothetical protein LUW75_23550 [Streptomyces sp. MRC013]|uniref:hypothetical protein n=1 Tax=Streptomyces sp. MRC013 TaxID=2898276 RepID=UPI0020262420|nr:hypothetical protein [Streptomyces sp. MRC013]URM92438.1 hypothetical protein LUW75_23550 [Streptomyces sp. MRC013]